ncbi:6-phosphogluconate dehydrogenase (decarboxylating) [Thermomonospora echinospora]|uniref:6-phosphogluconate dehydrogenase (Decarboxylating) n=1 Tax=Thermomonospora echinospora TaxID=1992 RepID=A0A1H6DDK5_9ACTN|nr:decarboxylating 6-phosphogluconate dehydrogenase [Thermomonospora echinospora]SEG83142.1 6-phosphogluconate dehydrogenase (decarboxylating) [Thermomonospora echinospora]
MHIGMIGLGRMGGNMAERLRRGGHTVVGYDRDPDISDVGSLRELVERLPAPRAVWVMVPAGEPTRQTIHSLGEILEAGDVIIDGGNAHYVDDQRHGEELAAKGIGFVDCGVSGGVWGLDNGYALMVGGEEEHVKRLMPIFETLKPEGEYGFVHAGPVGAGHFVKMVHNGIEYGMMQAFGEGYELIKASGLVTNVTDTFRSWKEGTVIRSWLLDLMVRALEADPDLHGIRGYAQDSGEGRWTVQAAVDHAVPLPVITAALYARFASRQEESEAMRVVAALRNQFGGHATEATKGADSPGADVTPPAP